jgi:hypothetical protein
VASVEVVPRKKVEIGRSRSKEKIKQMVMVVNHNSVFFRKRGVVVERMPEPKQIGIDLPAGYLVRFPNREEISFGPNELRFL